MYKRNRKMLLEGEESPIAKVLAAVGILAVLLIAGGIGYVYYGKTQEKAQLDPETFCPKEGPDSVTAVLVDRTDGINDIQAAALRNFILGWVEDVPEHGAFRVYEVGGTEGLLNPVLSVCNPGNVENVSIFTGNQRLTRERYEAKFMAPTEALIAGMLSDQEADASPIMEAIQQISVREFGGLKDGADGQLVIVSDLMQHTQQFSLYKQPPDVASFRRTSYGQKIESNLRGIETSIYLLHSTSQKQTNEVGQFWLDWLMLQGADLKGKFKVPG